MLIRNAEIWRQGIADIRIASGSIAEIGHLSPLDGEDVRDAHGGLLLPGLHDHHIHMAALAVAKASVPCGPPDVTDEAGLARALAQPGAAWLRGIGYHESVAGMPDVALLDRLAPHRPIRIQHRSGRMWFLNSLALDRLLESAAPPAGLEREGGRWTGRLFDEDRWLREALGSSPPAFAAIGAELAAMGVTGITDMSPANDAIMAAHFAREQASGHLPQLTVLAGTLALADAGFSNTLRLGPAKLHLHENALPDFDETAGFLSAAHAQDRATAIHCTTETELVFALAALEAAGPRPGDRIEHAGVAPDTLVEEMARMAVQVVTQPHFIAERGDHYLRDVEPRDHALLYRLGALRRAGLTVAAGSDAPYGTHDPWAAMRAAITRRTGAGVVVGLDEALTPEAALALYLGDPLDLTVERRIAPGAPAHLCLLDRTWAAARTRLRAEDVRLTFIAGSIVHDRVDQSPI
ncbi:amidohydrolase family protein [Sphingobium boeckii]|uniref:Putative amidohydrolase YtcJ n=1 Tax=Sphingobium boeckii TaxID=1082345 RepID=A0A7W9AJA3_9SPHN|nr:amidohydrolase family protein [Sphingobium boeckii]MBB5686737.1 putative amidohydrolase YtcJ [Sphingobium boeckii]